jgi:hypothetical protein
MERKTVQVSRKEVLTFLREHPLGTLITMSSAGVPEPAPVYMVTAKDFSLQFVTKIQTRKFRNVKVRPGVTFSVFDERTLTSVTVRGRCSRIEDPLIFAQVIERFEAMAGKGKIDRWVPPIVQFEAGRYVACDIRPVMIRYRKFAPSIDEPTLLAEYSFNPRRR